MWQNSIIFTPAATDALKGNITNQLTSCLVKIAKYHVLIKFVAN